MADDSEIRQLTSDSQARIAQDLVALRTLMQGLSQTQAVIERATLAYVGSVRALEKVEQLSSSPTLTAPNLPPPPALPPEHSGS